jgi:hypothetical protein
MDINKMLTEEEIDALYDSMGLGKGDSLTPRDFSAAEKWAQIEVFKRQKEDNAKKNFERNRPAHFVALLRDDKMRGTNLLTYVKVVSLWLTYVILVCFKLASKP